jgi:hypothetical protein
MNHVILYLVMLPDQEKLLGPAIFFLPKQLWDLWCHLWLKAFVLRKLYTPRAGFADKQCIRKVFRPLDFFHILLVLILKLIKYNIFLISLHTIAHIDKVKTVF